jgi:sugar phosphate isomerase/epimerase
MQHIGQPSVQLYTVRDAFGIDPVGTLERLADIGYRKVEPFGLLDYADQLRAALSKTGLTAPSAHMRLLDGRHDETFAAAADLGVETVIDPKIDETRWQTRDGIRRMCAELAGLAERAATFGLRIGYHNHAFELTTTVDGRPALDVFADELPSEVVLEIDLYWVAVAGDDPVDVVRRLGDRVRLLHLKDGPRTGRTRDQVAVGDGSLPLADAWAAAPSVELGVVELDDYAGDIWEPIEASFRYLTGGSQ